MLVMAAASVVQMTENSSARENATRVGSVGSEYVYFLAAVPGTRIQCLRRLLCFLMPPIP